jgi:hypothetical protein
MSNSKTDYNTFVRANLPYYITYDSVRNQYVTINGKRFVTYKEAQWYMDYIAKFGYQLNPTIDYAANGFSPDLVTDFANEVYATSTGVGSFSDYIQHTRSGAARMVDSDGVEKWSPHNLVPYSESLQDNTSDDATATASTGGDGPISDYALLAPDARTSDHGLSSLGVEAVVADAQYTVECYAKAGGGSFIQLDVGATSGRYANFDLSGGGAVGTLGPNTVSADITALDNGWFHLQMVYAPATTTQRPTIYLITSATAARRESWTATGSETVLVTGYRAYRSDLGGMINNPDTGNSYVPTDATAVFLPRRNAHVYDGSAWVNEGLLHEEAGTNLLLNTETLFTQSATVTNEPHTLSFTGTGTVTLSGTSTAGPLVGTGTGPENRVSLTFTPTAGTLTLTVSGTVSSAQLETGSIPTSWSPTIGTQATRAADTTASDNFSHDGTAMWGAIHGLETFADLGTADQILLLDWRADANNRITVSIDTDGAETGEITLTMVNGGVSATAAVDYLSPGVDQSMGIGWRVTGSDIAVSVGGGTAVVTATATGIPDLSSADATFSGNGFRALFTQGVGACGDAGIEEISA